MDDWFTVETIDPQTFAISEYRHWEETHCYLLCGRDRALLIDTGLGVADIRRTVERLTDLPVTVATTHVHWDHIGGHRYFEDIAVHELERDWLSVRFPLPLQAVRDSLMRPPCDLPAGFSIGAYQIFRGTPRRILRDGGRLDLGGREIQVIHTPGHSPGHCCFFEPGRDYLFSGDLIYRGCLYASYPSTDPRLFYDSVKRVQGYPVARILPGHHQLDIPVSILGETADAFGQIEAGGKLGHGGGLFSFGDIQILL